jgi:hypothetical protein
LLLLSDSLREDVNYNFIHERVELSISMPGSPTLTRYDISQVFIGTQYALEDKEISDFRDNNGLFHRTDISDSDPVCDIFIYRTIWIY